MKKFVFAISTILATMGAAQAQTQAVERPLRFLVGTGVSHGGDTLATAEYESGWSRDVKAGGLVYFTFGANYRLDEEFSIQGTLNYHVDDASAKNGKLKFERFPVEVLGYYHMDENWRVGAGLRYIKSAKLSSDGAAPDVGGKSDSTVSGVVELEYFFIPQVGMKVRYVKEKFKAAGMRDVNADHFGISGNFYF
ncbi:Outer membrane protein beta-barrel domain-containing protein [Duganella sp. CF458]|uniref:outer membrane beta-barrel protein n=1 Tax=Duganella sp. CF458 TaxID=1884368 RepID=UPI0008EB961F|nr:outer membrane beta-barrel protein [Duganella sp. CF458]SFH00913.1 Outer membrane protein beta-barrel domain-containing protein [Duganella sp. CF458]